MPKFTVTYDLLYRGRKIRPVDPIINDAPNADVASARAKAKLEKEFTRPNPDFKVENLVVSLGDRVMTSPLFD